jgi:hypothetical protein
MVSVCSPLLFVLPLTNWPNAGSRLQCGLVRAKWFVVFDRCQTATVMVL